MPVMDLISEKYRGSKDIHEEESFGHLSMNPAEEEKVPETECNVCLDKKMNTVLPCAHAFCEECTKQWLKKEMASAIFLFIQ